MKFRFGNCLLVVTLVFILVLCACSPKTTTPVPKTPYLSPTPSYSTPRPSPRPLLGLPRGDIIIGNILQQTQIQGSIEVANDGDSGLNIYRLDGPSFFICKSALPLSIPPGKTGRVEFTIDTSTPRSLDSSVRFQTNDSYTAKQELRVQGNVDPVSVVARERQEQYLEAVAVAQPQYLQVTDLGRKTFWQFRPLPNFLSEWSLQVNNAGPGNAEGILSAFATKGADVVQDLRSFHLSSQEQTTVKFNLDLSWLSSLFGGYAYEYEFSGVKEEILKQRTILDIFKVTMTGENRVDSFPRDSNKAKTWRESDYYKPDSITISLSSQGLVVSGSPATQQASPVPTSTQSIPKVPATAANLNLQVNNISETHSIGLFNTSINVQAHAQLTNTGGQDAHNIRAIIQAKAKSNGALLKLNNQDAMTLDLGSVGLGQSREINLPLAMQVATSTAMDLQQHGLYFEVRVISDETQNTFTYNYP